MRVIAASALLLFALSMHGAVPAAVESDFVVKDFKFESGESLAEVRLHYATIGTLHECGARSPRHRRIAAAVSE